MTNPADDKVKADKAAPELHLFLSTMNSMQYVFKDGQTAIFREGRFATSKKKYIEELQNEVDEGHPYIKRDENKLTITEEELKPDYEKRKQMREEIMAELGLTNRDFGTSSQRGGAGTGIANSQSVGSAVVGVNEQGMAAKLADLSGSGAKLTGSTKPADITK